MARTFRPGYNRISLFRSSRLRHSYGALPELVPPEVGFLTTHRQEMAEHIQSAQYSPKVCHEYARDLFNSSVMAEAYLKKYETVLNGEPLNKEVPHVIDIARRLPWD